MKQVQRRHRSTRACPSGTTTSGTATLRLGSPIAIILILERDRARVLNLWNKSPLRLMLVGYARTSTLEQEAGLDAQIRDLTTLGCRKLFREQVSSVGRRTQLEAAIDFCREG